jgi:hypothetical protein
MIDVILALAFVGCWVTLIISYMALRRVQRTQREIEARQRDIQRTQQVLELSIRATHARAKQ